LMIGALHFQHPESRKQKAERPPSIPSSLTPTDTRQSIYTDGTPFVTPGQCHRTGAAEESPFRLRLLQKTYINQRDKWRTGRDSNWLPESECRSISVEINGLRLVHLHTYATNRPPQTKTQPRIVRNFQL